MTVPVWIITEQDIEQHRPALIAWAEANGLDPQRIALYPLTIEQVGDRRVIAYDEHQVNEYGRPLVDPDRPTQVLRVHRSRTLRHALPEGIGRPLCTCTLGQHCPACLDDQSDRERWSLCVTLLHDHLGGTPQDQLFGGPPGRWLAVCTGLGVPGPRVE